MKQLAGDFRDDLLRVLQERFGKNMHRHKGMKWENVLSRIENNPAKLNSLHQMESTGGEPDVIGHDKITGEFIFCDCSAETPAGRRSLCYDKAALDSRKENKPKGSAMELAASMGIELLDEEQYLNLQDLGKFDQKTSSWISTPSAIRKLDGALFCDRRYDHVFVYHNGASSYYAVRGFRGFLKV